MATVVVPSDIYPALLRFFQESGLTKTLKAFEKETATDENEPQVTSKRRARALGELELCDAVSVWLEAQLAAMKVAKAMRGDAKEADEAPAPSKKKRKIEETVVEVDAAASLEEVTPKEKKQKKHEKNPKLEEIAEEDAVAEEPAETPKSAKKKEKKMEIEVPADEVAEQEEVETPQKVENVSKKAEKEKKKKQKEEKEAGVPFKRVNDSWLEKVKDSRLLDNTHEAKAKFGKSAGDSWGDSASADMIKVKGKGFRKEMAKKKRASWRGTGQLDQGVNSIPFSDSDDE